MTTRKIMFICAYYLWIIAILLILILTKFPETLPSKLSSLFSNTIFVILVYTILGPHILFWQNIVVSIKKYKKTFFSFKKSLIYKIIFVPIYIVIPIIIAYILLKAPGPLTLNPDIVVDEYAAFFFAFFVISINSILATVIILLISLLILYLVIVHLFTSFDNILHLIRIRKKTGLLFMVVHIILNLIIFIDILDSIYLAVHFRKKINKKPDDIVLLDNSKEISLC